jgi:hypothetical protein
MLRKMGRKEFINKRIFIALWVLCILGSWSVLPYVQYLEIVPATVSFIKLFLLVQCSFNF